MMKSEKEMIYFEEVDRIKVFWGLSYALESGTIEAWFVNDGALKGNELDRVFAETASRIIRMRDGKIV